MTGLQPPGVPVFIAQTQGPQMAAAMNSLVRDPLTFLLSKPVFRATRANALNVNEGVHQYIPWDTVAEDNYSGWTNPAVVGGGGSSTLSGATAIGAATFGVVSATGFAIGDYVRIESSGANVEYRQLSNVSGTTLTPSTPLQLAHSSGATVTEVTSDPSRYIIQAPGWYRARGFTSLSGTGAAGLSMVPELGVNFAAHTGVSGGGGWEGVYGPVPTGTTTQPKGRSGLWEFYGNIGDFVQLDHFFTTESAITAVDTTAGWQCALDIIWTGA